LIILGSSSQRRIELLKTFKIDFVAISPEIDESEINSTNPEDIVIELALKKANAIKAKADDTIISADTLVCTSKKIFGKPKNSKEAFEMLKELSGKWHKVFTGVCVKIKSEEILFYEMTKVKFRKLEDSEIEYYISTGEPLDKAGAYGIQGLGGVFVEKIIGDYTNVVGLPLPKLWKILFDRGIVGKTCQ